jgi:signal transduction histidine kinase
MGQNAAEAIGESEHWRAQLFDALRQAERKSAVSRVASTLSHALGTPLNVIAGRAAMIGMDGMSVDDMRNNARIVEQQVRAVANTLRQVLTFAREGAPVPVSGDAQDLAGRALRLLEPVAIARGVSLELESGPPLLGLLCSEPLLQILSNLVSLGIQREPERGVIRLRVVREHVDPPPRERGRVLVGQYIRFFVGYGTTELPVSLYESVYEPWLAAECADRDAALVLALSYGVAREHRGWVDVTAEPGPTQFVVNWPAPADAAP